MQKVSEIISNAKTVECSCPTCGAPSSGFVFDGQMTACMCDKCRRVLDKEDAATDVRMKNVEKWGILPIENLQTFSAYTVYAPAQEAVVKICQRWEARAQRNWLALFGKCGTGKDHLATAMLLHNAEKLRSCYADSSAGVMAMFRTKAYHAGGNGEMEALKWFEGLDVLVLRDVGVKQATNAEFGTIVEIVDRRYRARKAVIITSNMTPHEFKLAFSDRLPDRLWQCGMMHDGKPYVVCDWESWRRRDVAQPQTP